MMAYKETIDDQCLDCNCYHHLDAKMYLSNGDPGYPEENDCDYDWDCPYITKCKHLIDGEWCAEAYEGEDEDGTVECDGCDTACSYYEED
jgi:hypothetical protein